MMLLAATAVRAQINIGGSIYGGGNEGKTDGNTTVTVYEGDLNEVYGGARMADITGNTFVHIDGEHASSYIIINKVYGGNDISGTIGVTTGEQTQNKKRLPTELTQADANGVTKDWDAFVRVSSKENVETTTDKEGKKTTTAAVYIGQLFGGGNGEQTVNHPGLALPELGKTYLEIVG